MAPRHDADDEGFDSENRPPPDSDDDGWADDWEAPPLTETGWAAATAAAAVAQ